MGDNMQILIAGKYAPDGKRPMGGSQSWIDTVAVELRRLGHDVTLWEPGRPVVGEYDFGIIQHLKHTAPVVPLCKRTVQISHGIIDEEKPGILCDVTAFVSEGVRKHWHGYGPIIRQPINLEFWQPLPVDRKGGAVRFSYRRNELPYAREAAKALGMEYTHVHDATPRKAREILSRAQLVFASGRAALEAMACGAPVVIYDNRSSYQEALMGQERLRLNMQNSYSGRGGFEPAADDLSRRIDQALTEQDRLWRDWVVMYHDPGRIVQEIIEC